MFLSIIRLFREESGQDLAEYCLITALIALLGLAIFYKVSGGMGDLWGVANTRLSHSGAAGGASPAGAAAH